MKRAVFGLAVANIAALLTGLVRESTTAYVLGTTAGADAVAMGLFWVEAVTVLVLYGFLGYALVPVISRLRMQGKTSEIWSLRGTLLAWCGLLGIPLVILSLLFSEQLAVVLAPGFSAEQRALWTSLLPWTVAAAFVMLAGTIHAAILHAHSSYLAPAMGRSLFNLSFAVILAICAIPVGAKYATSSGAGVGLFLGAFSYSILQVFALRRLGGPWGAMRLWHPALPTLLRLALPSLITALLSVVMINGGLRLVASFLPPGSVASLNYAQRVSSLVNGLTMAVLTVSLTEISRGFAGEQQDDAGPKAVQTSLKAMLALIVPTTVLLFLLGRPLCALLFKRGHYNTESLELTLQCLQWFVLGLIPGALWGVWDRTASAVRKPWLSTMVTLLQVVVTLGMAIWLLPKIGINAIPLAYSVGLFVAAIQGHFLFRRYIDSESLDHLLVAVGRYAIAVCLAGFMIYMGVVQPLATAMNVAGAIWQATYILLVAAGFLSCYLAVCLLLRDPEICSLFHLVRLRLSFFERRSRTKKSS